MAKKVPWYVVYDWKSVLGVGLVIIIVAAYLSIYEIPEYIRNRKLNDYSGEVIGTLISINENVGMNQGREGNKEFIESYEVKYKYVLKGVQYEGANRIESSRKNSLQLKKLMGKPEPVSIKVKYDIDNPEKSLIDLDLHHQADTIYGNNLKDDPNYYVLTVQITDSTELKNVEFQIGRTEVIRVKVLRFQHYPTYVRNKYNVEVIKGDSLSGIYHIRPLDSVFAIEVLQDLGEGNVFIKTSFDGEVKLFPSNGMTSMASREWVIE